MQRAGSLLRAAALVFLSSFAVHQIRFLLAFSSGSTSDVNGQSFVGHVPPMLAATAFALIAARLWIAYSAASAPRSTPSVDSTITRSLSFGVAILSVYLTQEMLESALFSAHAQGVVAVLAGSGWVAVAAALCLGPLCILLDRGIGRLEEQVARAGRPHVSTVGQSYCKALFFDPIPRPSLSPLAFGIASRPPPLLG